MHFSLRSDVLETRPESKDPYLGETQPMPGQGRRGDAGRSVPEADGIQIRALFSGLYLGLLSGQ